MKIKFTKNELIKFKEKELLYNLQRDIEDKFYKSINKRVEKALELAVNLDDIMEIKESLRAYPESVTKVYLFGKIITREKEL